MACDARRDRTARRGGRRVDREAMELATWYHDANCEIARDYNEDRSAQLAREMLSSSPIRDEVARLVLVTKTHKCAPTCRCSAASRGGIGPTRRRSGRLRPRAPRRARPPQSHRRDRRTEGLVEFTCITLVSLVDNFLHMSVFRTSVRDMSVGAVSDPEAVMAAVDRFEAAKPNSHHPRLFAHWSQITQPLTIKMMGTG